MNNILNEFDEFEQNENLFERKYKNVHYWQYIRLEFVRTLIYDKKYSLENVDKYHEPILKTIKKLVTGSLHDIKAYVKLGESDLLYFDRGYYRYIDGRKVDPNFDFFEFEKEYSIQRCCHFNSYGLKNDDKEIGISIPDLLEGFVAIISHAMPIIVKDKDEEKYIRNLCDVVYERFGIREDADRIINDVISAVLHHKIHTKYYVKLIKKVNPKAIFLVCHYNYKLFPLYYAAHKLNIPTIELQHGLITNHEAFIYADTSDKGKLLPDYIFTYGEFWNRYIKLPNCMKPVPVGNPLLEDRRKKYLGIAPDEKSVVFYSDPDAGMSQAKFAIEFYERNKDKGYQVYFKFHPFEFDTWQQKYTIFSEHPGIHIVPKDKDVYEILASAKHHVTAVSTVMYEAVIFDVKRYVLAVSDRNQDYLDPLLDTGMAIKIYNVNEFEKHIYENTQNNSQISHEIWKENARENGLNILDDIINREML